MKYIFALLLLVVFGCSNLTQRSNNGIKESVAEDFTTFSAKFYNDINFQRERIIKPLQGTIKAWDDDVVKVETWDKIKISVAPKEEFMQVYKNLKTNLIKNDAEVIEKYWIEQSGFIIEKKFILKSGKWYLESYNISNL